MKIKTLVVDNNPVVLKMIASVLLQEGCEVQTAETGLEALEILEDYHPAILFTDLIMPRVSGEQLCRIIRGSKQLEDIFIVVVSAILMEDGERIGRDVCCDLCIAKGNVQETRLHLKKALQTYRKKRRQQRDRQLNKEEKTHIPKGLQPSVMTSELLFEKHHLHRILANLEEGILEVTEQGKVVTANKAAQKILDLSEEQLLGCRLGEVADWSPHQQTIENWLAGQLSGGTGLVLDIYEDAPVFLGERVVTLTLLPVSESGSHFGLCILRDITRQSLAEKHTRELEEAFRLIKKMEAMSCMAGGVAHDFNNLLTVICGNLDILILQAQDKRQNGQQRQQLLDQARAAAMAAVDLTRQISCFSNFGIISREEISVNELVKYAVDDFFDEHADLHRVAYCADDCMVSVDPTEMFRALTNVLQNAREASAGERIEIQVSRSAFSAPRLMAGQYVPAGDYARIDARDFGTGIEPDNLFQIFDPYYSTKQRGAMKGMGLGLTVVYATLRNHGGYVVVSSVPGKETLVSMFLPIVRDAEKILGPVGNKGAEQKRVVLVESAGRQNEITPLLLSHLGFIVTTVSDRSEALRELKNIHDSPSLPRPLVIVDISDIDDRQAAETCRMFHEIDAELHIIAAGGSRLSSVMANCQAFGFANILPNPYSLDCLRHVTGAAPGRQNVQSATSAATNRS